jgi:hypothetical protein
MDSVTTETTKKISEVVGDSYKIKAQDIDIKAIGKTTEKMDMEDKKTSLLFMKEIFIMIKNRDLEC